MRGINENMSFAVINLKNITIYHMLLYSVSVHLNISKLYFKKMYMLKYIFQKRYTKL